MNEFSDFFANSHIAHILTQFHDVSFAYDYFIDDLLSPYNIEKLIKNHNTPLPPQPEFYINRHVYQKYPENVLTLLRVKRNAYTDIVIEKGDMESNHDAYPYGCTIKVGSITRLADFAVVGKVLHKGFDFDGVCSEIKDHIAWTVYEAKRIRNISLAKGEEKAVIDLYKRMAVGEYGATHRAARLIGLWLWDERERFKNVKTDSCEKVKRSRLEYRAL